MSTIHPLLASRVDLPGEEIAGLCRKYDVEELPVFGLVLRDDFRPDSDIDFLASFKNNDVGPWLAKLQNLEADLSCLLGRKADVVLKSSVEKNPNYIRRRRILEDSRVIYVA
jgi:predicted nucleotidyltransferase